MEKDLSVAVLCDYYGGLLTEKQRQAVELYYNDDLSLAEMADQLSITRQGAHDNIQRGTEKLHEYENVLHVAKKSMFIKDKLAELSSAISDLPIGTSEKEKLQHLIDDIKSL